MNKYLRICFQVIAVIFVIAGGIVRIFNRMPGKDVIFSEAVIPNIKNAIYDTVCYLLYGEVGNPRKKVKVDYHELNKDYYIQKGWKR